MYVEKVFRYSAADINTNIAFRNSFRTTAKKITKSSGAKQSSCQF